jgi:hypothetical protein
MVTSAELQARYEGVTNRDVARWVKHGHLQPAPRAGVGSGYRYDFDDLDEAVVSVLVQWRRATKGQAVTRLIAWAARAQLAENPDAIVAVDLGHGVVVTIGREP